MATRLTILLISGFTGLLGACEIGTLGGTAGPCAGVNPPPECSAECTADTGCSLGFYCGPADTCTADCTAGGGECFGGTYCSSDGRCLPGDDINRPDAAQCPSALITLEPVTPTVVLVIDQSGSMTQNFNGPSRWEALVTALVDPVNGIIGRLESSVSFGAALYTSNNGNAGGMCPILQEVAPALDNYAAINTLLLANQPQGDTPTAETIDQVVVGFPGADPEKPAPRIIVLATDGNPDTCVDADAHDLASQNKSETSVVGAYGAGIETFVLSVGDDVAQTHLQRLANAGLGKPLDTGTEKYYVANNPAELVAAFDEIVLGIRDCLITLNGTITLSEAETGTVTLDGVELEFGVDWRMVDGNTLELLGAACDKWLTQADVSIEAEFPCGVVVL